MSKTYNEIEQLQPVRLMLRTIQLFNYFRVHNCSNLTVDHNWHIDARKNNDFHLLLVLGGKGVYRIEGVEVPLHRGRLIFISNDVEHSADPDPKDPPHIIPVRFFIYDNRTNKPSAALERPAVITHVTPHVEKFQDMFENLHRQHLLNRGPFRTGYCSTLIHHIICDLLFECSREQSGRNNEDNRILEVQQFIAQHPEDRSTVSQLAAMAHLSEKYFTKLFKQQTGVTPKRYQLNSRLSRARAMLEDGLTVKETSLRMGYPDPYVFSKQFKALLGVSPSQVR